MRANSDSAWMRRMSGLTRHGTAEPNSRNSWVRKETGEIQNFKVMFGKVRVRPVGYEIC